MIGPQVSAQQLAKVSSYVDIGRAEGAEVLIGGKRAEIGGEFAGGYFYPPTVLTGDNKMRVFQEIFGPVLAVTTFRDEAEAIEIANDTLYGLGAGVWTVMAAGRSAWGAPSRRAECGRTATTSTRRALRSAVTRSPASAGRPTR
jgi:acyl-CoA reductase-like NAD-dependent aldehyde dehydrogenase